MYAVAVQIRTTCERCRQPLPVNRLATRVPCLSCDEDNPFVAELWGAVLAHVVCGIPPEGVTGDVVVAGRTFRVTAEPAPIPDDVRPRTADLCRALPTVVGTDNEDPEGAVLPAARRMPRTSALHPANRVRRWVLVVDDLVQAPEDGLAWTGDAVVLRDGGVVVVVRHDRGPGVACYDGPQLRWLRRDLRAPEDAMVLAPAADGVWVAAVAWPHALRLRGADGVNLEERGVREPEGAKVHHLDLRGVQDLLICEDGSWLVHAHQRLWRYDAAGNGVPTWSGGWIGRLLGGARLPLYRDGRPTVDRDAPLRDGQAEHRPLVVLEGRWALGPDGGLVQAGWDQQTPFVAAFRPNGNRRWLRPVAGAIGRSPPQVGRDGSVWVVAGGAGGQIEVVAFSADGDPVPGPAWGRFAAGQWAGVPRLLRVDGAAALFDGTGRIAWFEPA